MNLADKVIRFIEENKQAEAKQYIQSIKSGGTDEERFVLAEDLSRLGFIEEARELYERLLQDYPDEGELLVLAAECCVELDNEDEALEYISRVGTEDPNYPAALLLEADLYQMQGLFEVSEHKLQEASSMLPDEPVIEYALGELYMSQGRFLEAVKHYENALARGEDEIAGTSLHARMAEALSAGGAFEEAIPYYEKALRTHTEINVQFGLAFTSYLAGSHQKAIKHFLELKEMDPDYYSLYLYLAKCYESEEEVGKALSTIQEGLALDEYNKDLLQYAGKIALKAGNEELAEEYLRGALALDPGFLEPALTLNSLLIHQERYEDVLEIVSLFEQEGEADPRFFWDAAVSFRHTEQYSEALKYYQLAYNEFKHNREFLADYGYFLAEEGMREEASQVFRDLLQDDPANEEWLALLERLED